MSRVKTSGFNLVALRFVTDVSRTLKMNATPPSECVAEPTPEVAWEYVKGNILDSSIRAASDGR